MDMLLRLGSSFSGGRQLSLHVYISAVFACTVILHWSHTFVHPVLSRSHFVTRRASSSLTYKDDDYWDSRYRTGDKGSNQDLIDDRGEGWLCAYAGPVQETLKAITGGDTSKLILNIGCGVDRLSEDMYADGFTNLMSSDYSPAAVSEMSKKTASTMPLAKWFVDDVRRMNVPSQTLDIVVDKGTLDAVLTRPSPFHNAALTLREVQRVLKVGGSYFLITHGRGDPDTWRLPLLTMPHLSFQIAKTPDLGGFYIYICTKTEEPSPESETAAFAQAEAWAKERDKLDEEAELDYIDDVGQ